MKHYTTSIWKNLEFVDGTPNFSDFDIKTHTF